MQFADCWFNERTSELLACSLNLPIRYLGSMYAKLEKMSVEEGCDIVSGRCSGALAS